MAVPIQALSGYETRRAGIFSAANHAHAAAHAHHHIHNRNVAAELEHLARLLSSNLFAVIIAMESGDVNKNLGFWKKRRIFPAQRR